MFRLIRGCYNEKTGTEPGVLEVLANYQTGFGYSLSLRTAQYEKNRISYQQFVFERT